MLVCLEIFTRGKPTSNMSTLRCVRSIGIHILFCSYLCLLFRLRGVGLSSIACGYMLVTYYSMLLAWVCNAFVDSFGSDNFWAQDEVTGSEAKGYFFNTIIGMGTLGGDLKPTRLVGKNVGYSFFSWAVIYLCVAFGLKWTGRITFFTVRKYLAFGVFIVLYLLLLTTYCAYNYYVHYNSRCKFHLFVIS